MCESELWPRCGEEVEDAQHRWWACPAFDDIRREEELKTAAKTWDECGGDLPDCFKHCGLVTNHMVQHTWSERMRQEEGGSAGTTRTCRKAWTDGSAVESKDTVNRRAGWGVKFDDGHVIGGPLDGRNQTVYRAELRAVVAALEHTIGPLEVITDCRSVWDGFQGRPLEKTRGGQKRQKHTMQIDASALHLGRSQAHWSRARRLGWK